MAPQRFSVGDSSKGGLIKKLTASLLVFLFIFPVIPVNKVLAQETFSAGSESSTNTVSPAPIPEPPPPPPLPTPVESTDANATVSPVPEPITPVDSNPGDAAADGEVVPDNLPTDNPQFLQEPLDSKYQSEFESKRPFDIDGLTGSLNYNVPIVIPPGRNGVQPDLSLTYSSNNIESGGYFGKGWDVSIPYIVRVNKYGSDKLYASSTFSSSVSGDLATTTTSGLFYAESDGGNNLKYVFADNKWTVSDKNGWIYLYGTTTAARQDDPTDSSKVYKWMLEEVRDPNDNYIKFSYYKDSGQIYPSTINYTGHGSTDGIFGVSFERELRNSTSTISYTSDFRVETKYRIKDIVTSINGSMARDYAISYGEADNGLEPLINSIIETGVGSMGSTTLPAQTFGYTHSKDSWNHVESRSVPENFIINSNKDSGTRLIDVNGDGLEDVVRSYKISGAPYTENKAVYINTGSDWVLNESWSIPEFFVIGTAEQGVNFGDVNGDGLVDMVRSWKGGDPYSEVQKVYINSGSGWTLDTSWTVPEFFKSNSEDLGVQMLDVNGDGLVDIVRSYKELGLPNTEYKGVYLNTGHSWVLNTSWTIPEIFIFGLGDLGVRLFDVNGDGLVDMVRSYNIGSSPYTEYKSVYLNTGSGWTSDTTWTIPEIFKFGSTDEGVRFMDLNGDGLTDIVRSWKGGDPYSESKHVYLNTGYGWAEDTSWTIPEFFVSNTTDLGVRFSDIDGDRSIDLVNSRNDGETSFNGVYLNNGSASDYFASSTSIYGGSMFVAYKGSPQYKNGGGDLLNPNLPYVLQTVSAIGYSDAVNTIATTTYEYAGGDIYYGGPQDNRIAGFNLINKTDPVGNVTKTYYHQGNDTASTTGEYSDNKYKIGKPYRVERYDNSNNLYEKIINKWESVNHDGSTYFVQPTQSVETVYDGDSDHKDRAASYSYDSTNGNISQQIDWGEVTGSNDGTFSDTGSDKFTTTLTYATSAPIYLIDDETVTDQSATKIKETRTYYDSQSLGTITKGNPTKTEFWKSGSSYIDTEKTYNSYGLVTQDKDPRDKATNYYYDSYNLYVSTSTNPKSQSTIFEYDYSLGKPKQVKDPNGFVYQTVYDGVDRIKEEKQPDLTTPTTLVTKSAYAYVDSGTFPLSVHKTNYLNSATSTDSYSYFDGFGRVIQERNEAKDSNMYSVKDTKFNSVGLVKNESLPYFSSGSSKTSATTTGSLYVNYTYDPLFRVANIGNALGTTTNAYDDWKVTVTDADGKVKNLYKDAYENLVKVDEINGASTYTTNYEYDGNKNLTKITDALGNVRNFTYDGLSRRLTAEDLHDTGDSYFGTWHYYYDNAGNITSTTDPKSQEVDYGYDDLNRVITENYMGAAGTEVQWSYDNCTNGIGHMCSATTSTSFIVRNEFDPLGNLSKETKLFGVAPYATTYTYDRLGNVATIVYPDHSTTTNAYNTAGQLDQITWKSAYDNSVNQIVKNLAYSPLGQVTFMEYGNGATTTNTYNSAALYRMSNKVTRHNTTKFQDLAYTYDAVGNITRIVDSSNTNSAKTTDYTYDDLHRLSSASTTNAVAGNYAETYSYNAIGDITNKSDQGSYSYSGNTGTNYANPHAVTSVASSTLTYDNDGNLLTYGSQSNTWDYKNRLTQSVNGTATSSATYDPNGDRATYTDPDNTNRYVNKLYSTLVSPGVPSRYIYAGDQLVATIEDSQSGGLQNGPELGGVELDTMCDPSCSVEIPYVPVIHYVHDDHLTGSNTVSDANAALEETIDFYPNGKIKLDDQVTTFNEKHKFTGQIYDNNTDLNYMEARYQNGNIGRFISQDPVFQSIGDLKRFTDLTKISSQEFYSNPQNLNSYSYTVNNPLKYVDYNGNFYHLIVGAGLGALGGITAQYVSDVLSNVNNQGVQPSVLIPTGGLSLNTAERYGEAALDGAAVGFATAINPLAGAAVAAGTSVTDDLSNGQNVNLPKAVLSAGSTMLFGALDGALPAVPGRLPNIGSKSFFVGAHTEREAALEAFQVSLSSFAASLKNYIDQSSDQNSVSKNKSKPKKKG